MELKLSDVKNFIGSISKESNTHIKVGGKYLFRTVTMIYTGEVVSIQGLEVKLKNAAWIADTGRFSENLVSCEFSEVEMYPNEVVLFMGSFLDVSEIDKLPTKTK